MLVVRCRPARTCGVALLCVLAAALTSCQSRSLLERAIRARGGPLRGWIESCETQVYRGFPGTWEYQRLFVAPNLYAWKIVTAGEPIYHLFDGATVRSFVAGSEVGSDGGPRAPLRSHARWFAVIGLDALDAPGVRVEPLPAAALPAGVAEGLSASLVDGSTYRLGFDAATLLVWAAGPVDLAPLGGGELNARFSDYRRVGGLRLPFAASYTLAGKRLADEQVRSLCLAPADATAASFAAPDRLPSCS